MVALFLLLVSMSFWMFVEYEVVKKNYTNNNKVSRRAKMNNVWLALVALFCFIALYTSFFMRWQNEYVLYWSYLGSLIAIGGLVIRRNAIKTLGKHFDGLLQLKENQKLIQHGLYRYFRHPSYTGTIIAFFGFGIAFFHTWSACVLLVRYLATLVRFRSVLVRFYPLLDRKSAVLDHFFPHLERSGTFSEFFGWFGSVSVGFSAVLSPFGSEIRGFGSLFSSVGARGSF